MKLISEFVDQNLEYLVENTAKGKTYFVEGRWATAEEPNRNGRVYPMAVMENALGKYNKDYVAEKRAVGELNHPDAPSINLDRVSHMIESLKMEGNYVNGRAKVLGTPMGEIVKNLIDEGVKLGVSTRGLGSLKEGNGYKVVQNDFFISAIDVVQDPSGAGCWVNGIMEGVDYQMLEDGRIQQIIVDTAKKRIDEAKAIKAFDSLMKQLRG
jgi:hypothetical protein